MDILLAPTVNLMRTPLGGRGFEFFAEDPVLTAGTGVSLRARRAVGGRRRHRQALRGQRLRDRALDLRRPDSRVRAARALSGAVRGLRPRGRGMACHGRLQQGQRHADDRERAPAAGRAQERVGLRRRGHLGLARRSQHGGDDRARDSRPVHARPGRAVGRSAHSRSRTTGVSEEVVDDKVVRLLRLARRVGALGEPGEGRLRWPRHAVREARQLAGSRTAPTNAAAARRSGLLRDAAAASFVLLRNAGTSSRSTAAQPPAWRSSARTPCIPSIQGGGSAGVLPAAVRLRRTHCAPPWPGGAEVRDGRGLPDLAARCPSQPRSALTRPGHR